LTDLQDAFGPELASASAAWNWRGFGQPILGTPGDDRLYGTPEDDVLLGLAGDDVIYDRPGPGSATVEGNNRILAGPGNDAVYAGYGDDTVDGGPGDDVIYGSGNFASTPGGTIVLWGRDGADHLDGGPGDDTIFGASGADTIDGGPGDDLIRGSVDADLLRGGPGADTFGFGFLGAAISNFRPDSGVGAGQRDIVQDFRSGQDKIDLTGYGPISPVRGLAVADHGDGLLVSFEALAGGRWVAQEIEVFGARALTAADFVL
jgi:Ca2+-binding RTX toxin-like protein